MTPAEELDHAELRAAEARAKLNDTVGTLQAQLAPRKLAREAADGVSEGAQQAARTSVDAVRRNPALAAGAAALAGLLLLRKPLARTVRRVFRRKKTRNPRPLSAFEPQTPVGQKDHRS